jgi:hypothetical protein
MGCVGEQLGPVVVPLEVLPLLPLLVVPELVELLLVELEVVATPVVVPVPTVPLVPFVVPVAVPPVDPLVPFELCPEDVGDPPRAPPIPSFGEKDTPQPEANSTSRPRLESRDLTMVDFLSGVAWAHRTDCGPAL